MTSVLTFFCFELNGNLCTKANVPFDNLEFRDVKYTRALFAVFLFFCCLMLSWNVQVWNVTS